MDVKQVIVIRKDLKCRRGKEIAQGCHASISWLVDRVVDLVPDAEPPVFSAEERAWMEGGSTKVCLQVPGEKELVEVYKAAKAAGLTVHLITDAGKTEFAGVPTKTCLCIGPNRSEDVDQITSRLNLY